MRKIFVFLVSTLLFINAFAQQKPPTQQKPKFFPLKKGNEWTYISSVFEPYSNGDPKKSYPLVKFSPFYTHITDTLTVEQKKYYLIQGKDSNIIQIIRFDKNTGFYYSRVLLKSENKYSPDKLFLKNNIKLNSSWNVGSGSEKINFKVVAVLKDTAIRGEHYKNVIEVHELIPNTKLNKTITVKHWYAENIGEVATYISYPLSNAVGDIKLELSNYPTAK